MSDRLYTNDIKKILPYRNLRSIRRWCNNNGVRLLKDIGTKPLFVFKDEFEKALNRLKDFTVESDEKHLKSDGKDGNYKPQGTIEKSFLQVLQRI